MRPAVGAICVVALLAKCGGEPSGRTQGTVRDSAGVRLVTLPPVNGEVDPLELALDPAWDPTPGREFGELVDLEVLPDGRAVLLDRYGARVLIAASGDVQAEFGGPGEGPGEFNPEGLSGLIATDSSVVVPDLFQQRLTEFALDGSLLGSRPYPGAPTYAIDWRRHPRGGLVFRVLNPAGGGDRVLWMGRDGVDTIHAFPLLNDTPNLLLEPIALWDLQRERMVTASSAAFAVRSLDVEARRIVWIARRDPGRLEITEGDRAALEDILIGSATRESGGAEPSPEARARIIAQVVFPKARPALAGLHVGAGGDVWVREATEVWAMGREALRVGSAAGYGGVNWDVLTPDGLLRARVRLPAGFTVTRVEEHWLYGIQADDFGVQRPARVEVPW